MTQHSAYMYVTFCVMFCLCFFSVLCFLLVVAAIIVTAFSVWDRPRNLVSICGYVLLLFVLLVCSVHPTKVCSKFSQGSVSPGMFRILSGLHPTKVCSEFCQGSIHVCVGGGVYL